MVEHPEYAEHRQLQRKYAEAREKREMSLESLDDAIAEKCKQISLLKKSKADMLEEQRRIREKHLENMDLVDSECAKKYLELSQIEEELHPFPEDSESSELEARLSRARDQLAETRSKHAAELSRLREEFKADELKWMVKMVQSGEVDSNDRTAMMQATKKKFVDLQREHQEMSEELANRERRITSILRENKKLVEKHTAMRLELSSMREMNSFSHEKLYCLTTQASLLQSGDGEPQESSVLTDTSTPSRPPLSTTKLFRRRRPNCAGRHLLEQSKNEAEERVAVVDESPQFVSFNAALPDFSLLSNMLDLHLAHRAKATGAFLDSARQYNVEVVVDDTFKDNDDDDDDDDERGFCEGHEPVDQE